MPADACLAAPKGRQGCLLYVAFASSLTLAAAPNSDQLTLSRHMKKKPSSVIGSPVFVPFAGLEVEVGDPGVAHVWPDAADDG